MQVYGWELLKYVTTLASLVNIDIMTVETQCFQFVMWPHVSTCLKGYVNLWVKFPHKELPTSYVLWPLV